MKTTKNAREYWQRETKKPVVRIKRETSARIITDTYLLTEVALAYNPN